MAIRASATVRPPSIPPSPPQSSTVISLPKAATPPRLQRLLTKPNSLSTVLPLLAFFVAPNEATAQFLPKEKIVSSLNQVDSAIDQIQELGSGFLSTAGQVFGAVSGAVKPGVDAALPILKQAGEQALKIASPVVSEASKKAQEAIQSTGIDTQPVLTAAQTVADAAQQTTKVIDDAKPIATSTVQIIASAEPIVILGTGGALILAYLLLPPVLSAVSFNLRGYKGGLTPAQALDLMSTKNYMMIDVRSEKDKDKAGIPRLPSSAKNKLISIPPAYAYLNVDIDAILPNVMKFVSLKHHFSIEELPSKLRNIIRNSKKVEAELVALKISYLKKLNQGSSIVILDSYSDTAKTVAKALTKLGFKNCWIVNDGFSGGKGWLQSRLGTDPYNLAFAEVISPSRIIPAAARRFGTSSTSSAKLLTGGSD